MNKKRLDVNRFEYHDNVSVDFTQDTQKKETIIYYDYYQDIDSFLAIM